MCVAYFMIRNLMQADEHCRKCSLNSSVSRIFISGVGSRGFKLILEKWCFC